MDCIQCKLWNFCYSIFIREILVKSLFLQLLKTTLSYTYTNILATNIYWYMWRMYACITWVEKGRISNAGIPDFVNVIQPYQTRAHWLLPLQTMRKTNFQLYFYIYSDIFNALDICVFNTHSLFPSRRKYLTHLRLHFFSYIPDNIKNFFNVFRKCRKGILVWNWLRTEAATGGVL